MDRKMFVYTDNYGDDNNVSIRLDMYRENDNLFIGLEEHDEEFDFWSSYCNVTVNIAVLPFLESTIESTLGGQEKINFLVQNGFGELAGYSLKSGFCTYPVFRFNADKLKETDSEFFEKYAKAHGVSLESHLPLKEQIENAEKQGDEWVAVDPDGEIEKLCKDVLEDR